jgi:serine protease inhibitor
MVAMAQPAIVDRNNAFALDFYLQWRKSTDKNIVFSPFSMSAALGMVYPGARNTTADQMKTALHFHKNIGEQNLEFHKLMKALSTDESPLAISNSLWIQKGFRIEGDFLKVNSTYFDSNLHQVDFAGAADSARVAINSLIEQQTRDKIKDLLPGGSISQQTRLVLTNAVYFKDSWAKPFDPKQSREREFFVARSKAVKTTFMELNNEEFNFFENDVVMIAELPYASGKFSMLILLPKRDVASFEKSLNVSAYRSWNLTRRKFRTIQLPSFKIDHEVRPVEILKRFGMTDAFQEGKADFTGMSKDGKLFISGIFHKAFIEVNEQ